MTIQEQIERQDRANAAVEGISYAAYRARTAERMAWYLAHKREIDAEIARSDAELSTGDDDDDES